MPANVVTLVKVETSGKSLQAVAVAQVVCNVFTSVRLVTAGKLVARHDCQVLNKVVTLVKVDTSGRSPFTCAATQVLASVVTLVKVETTG